MESVKVQIEVPVAEAENVSESKETSNILEQFTTSTIYEMLDQKKCFSEDLDEERKIQCLYVILEEKAKRIGLDYKVYEHTADYAINKAIHEVYGEEALVDLSPAYRNYLAINSLPILTESELEIKSEFTKTYH